MSNPNNPRICYSRYSGGWFVEFYHARLADFVWTGSRLYSNFGGGVGMVKMKDPEYFETQELAQEALTTQVIPWMKENKPSWMEMVRGWPV